MSAVGIFLDFVDGVLTGVETADRKRRDPIPETDRDIHIIQTAALDQYEQQYAEKMKRKAQREKILQFASIGGLGLIAYMSLRG